MGYAVTSVDIEGVKRALFEVVPFNYPFLRPVVGVAYQESVKITLDFDSIDYLEYLFTTRSGANNTTVQINAGATTLLTSGPWANNTTRDGTLDCTGVSGSQSFIIQIKNSNAGQTSWLENVMFYHREA